MRRTLIAAFVSVISMGAANSATMDVSASFNYETTVQQSNGFFNLSGGETVNLEFKIFDNFQKASVSITNSFGKNFVEPLSVNFVTSFSRVDDGTPGGAISEDKLLEFSSSSLLADPIYLESKGRNNVVVTDARSLLSASENLYTISSIFLKGEPNGFAEAVISDYAGPLNDLEVQPVPLPASALFLIASIFGMGALRRRRASA